MSTCNVNANYSVSLGPTAFFGGVASSGVTYHQHHHHHHYTTTFKTSLDGRERAMHASDVQFQRVFSGTPVGALGTVERLLSRVRHEVPRQFLLPRRARLELFATRPTPPLRIQTGEQRPHIQGAPDLLQQHKPPLNSLCCFDFSFRVLFRHNFGFVLL